VTAEKTQAPPPVQRRRQQQRTIETRLRIIRAAISQFAQVGFDAATTRGIAEAADVQHSLVIYHFGSKDEIWNEAVREAVSWSARRDFGVIGPVPEDDPVSRLKRNFAHYIRFSAENPDFFLMLSHENRAPSARLNWLVEHHSAPTTAYLIELIRRAQALGAFVEGDPLTLLYLFLGAATSPYRSAPEIDLISGRKMGSAEEVDAHIAHCERLFFRGQAAPAPPG
jgi:AcrR family transcriptional regulator